MKNTPAQNAAMKKYNERIRAECKEKGVCYVCRVNVIHPSRRICDECGSKSTKRKHRRMAEGLCVSCPEKSVPGKQQCEPCALYAAEQGRIRRDTQKETVFKAYGGYRCNCSGCNETNPSVLQIDHVNNDGWDHRKQIKSKYICEWIIEHDFPDDFQILCANCNFSKRMRDGTCHHSESTPEPFTQYDTHTIDPNDYILATLSL